MGRTKLARTRNLESTARQAGISTRARHEHKDGSTDPPGPVAGKTMPVSTSGWRVIQELSGQNEIQFLRTIFTDNNPLRLPQ